MPKDLVEQHRFCRGFYQDTIIPYNELADIVDTARLAALASNAQTLKFRILCTPEEYTNIFPYIAWTGALRDWDGPKEGEKPSAYIIIVCDLAIGKNKQWDDGVTAQIIMLVVVEKGYGGCTVGSCMRPEIDQLLGLDPKHYNTDLMLAPGKPREKAVLVSVKEDGPVAYYRDGDQVHYALERSLEDIPL